MKVNNDHGLGILYLTIKLKPVKTFVTQVKSNTKKVISVSCQDKKISFWFRLTLCTKTNIINKKIKMNRKYIDTFKKMNKLKLKMENKTN